MSTEQELKSAMAEYRVQQSAAKEQARAELRDRVSELLTDARVELSKKVHAAHASGLSKVRINAALGLYSNTAQSAPIWDAYSPENPTDLRSGKSNPVTALTTVRESESGLIVTLRSGLEIAVVNPRLMEDREMDTEWVEWDYPSAHELDTYYTEVFQAVLSHMRVTFDD